jgi:hypothetical protein
MNDPLGLFEDDNNDPLGLFADEPKKKAGFGTSFKQALASAGTAMDQAISLPAGALASVFSQEQGDEIFRGMDAREATRKKWANPEELETTLGNDVLGMAATLPAQIPAMVGQAATKGIDLIRRGEDVRRAQLATVADAGLNAAGLGPMAAAKTVLGRGAIGASANTAFGAGSDAITQLLAQQEETKQAYDPYDPRRRALDAMVGGVAQGVMGERPTAPRRPTGKAIDAIRADAKPTTPQPDATRPTPGSNAWQDAQLKLRGEMDARETTGPLNETAQLDLIDQPLQGRMVSPYEAVPGDWRVDENGMPIKADLSMELQNLQQPLQRNLWGDELDVNFPRDPNKPLDMDGDIQGGERFSDPVSFRNDPENQIPLTEAIDSMEPGARAAALEQTQMGRELPADGPMEAARMQAEIAAASGDNFKGFNSKMRKQGGGLLIGNKKVEVVPTEDGFVAKVGDKEVGYLRSNITPEQRAMLGEDASVDMVKVQDDFKGKGVGKALYDAWSTANEGNVIPSGKTSPAAWQQWKRNLPGGVDKFVNQEAQRILGGADPQLVIGNIPDPEVAQRVQARAALLKKQGGGLKIDWADETKKMENGMISGDFIPTDPAISDTLAKARTEADGKLWKYTQSGSTSAAMKSGSTLIQAVSRTVQNALKRSELQIRDSVFPAEAALRKLSRKELADLGDVFKDEMFQDYRYDGEVLAKHLSVKQIEAYTKMRDMFDVTLSAQNAAREAQGKPPITAKEAYVSSRWQGDFRRPVYDADGKLVWYLAGTTKWDLEAQTKALLKEQPNLVIDKTKDHTVHSVRGGTDIQSMYSTMLDILGRNDPAVLKMKELVETSMGKDLEGMLAQEKHFERKGNVRGFVGDRPGKANEAVNMFEQQIQYAKNAFKWSEMQKSSDNLKALLADPEVQTKQPNNVAYAREYVKNALGQGEGKIAKALDDSFRDMGVSPQVINNAVGNVKSFFIMQKLAVSAGYTLSNLVQTSNVLPYLMNLRSQGYKGNPATAVGVGVPMGLAMGVSHYLKAAGGDYMSRLPNDFYRNAFKYAEENGVTARSVYDEAPLETGFNPVAKVANVAAKTMTIPETFIRAVAFMSYSQMLKDSGKFSDMKQLFQKAEELVNMSMVDYRETERPLMFSKAGTTGNFLNTLQTYPISFYNQWLYMGSEAAQGRPAGILAMGALQMTIAGAMGLPGFEDTEKFYKWVRDNMLKTDTWNKAMKNKFLADPKLWLMENLGEASVYGVLSDESGIGLTSRVAAPGAGAMLQSPIGPITDIAKQVGNWGKAVADPTNTTKWAQAAMSSTPTGLQGFLETQPFMKDITFVENADGSKTFMKASDLEDRRGGYTRDENEVDLRKWGLRSQDEVVTRDASWSAVSANQQLNEKSSQLIDRIYSAARRGDTKKVGELLNLYTELTGKEISSLQIENQLKEERLSDLQREGLKAGENPRKLLNVGRVQKFLNERQEQ